MVNSGFTFFGGSEQKESETPAPSGGDVSTPPVSGADAQANAALDAVRAKSGKRGRRSKDEIEAELNREREKVAQEYEKLFSPESWGAIMRAPADMMLSLTHNELWRIGPEEMIPLSASAAACAKMFMSKDAKYVAVTMLCITLLQTYGARTVMYQAELRRQRAAKDKEKTE